MDNKNWSELSNEEKKKEYEKLKWQIPLYSGITFIVIPLFLPIAGLPVPFWLFLVFLAIGALLTWWGISIQKSLTPAGKAARGKWNFPCEEFYEQCLENKVSKLSDDYSYNKAIGVAKSIFEKHEIPAEIYGNYCNRTQIAKYFATGKSIYEEKKRKSDLEAEEAEKERQRQYMIPHTGTPTEAENIYLKAAAKAQHLTGSDKRKCMLEMDVALAKLRVDELEDLSDSISKYQTAYVVASQKNTKDWGTQAGLAAGLTGSSAMGAAVASQIMAENAAIEAENKIAAKKAYKELHQMFGGTETELYRQLAAAREKLEQLKKILENVHSKIVVDETPSHFQTAVQFSTVSIEKTKSDILALTIQCENHYSAVIPEGIEAVVDGVLKVRILCDGVTVDNAIIPLPTYGIPLGQTVTFTGFSKMYMDGNRKYTAQITPVKLWAIEAS